MDDIVRGQQLRMPERWSGEVYDTMSNFELAVKLLGIFLGVLARTLLPWVRKLRRGKVAKFDPRYFYSAVGTLLIGIVITLLIFPSFQTDPTGGRPEDWVKLFSLAFGFGFGWNALVFEAGKWAGAFDEISPKPEQR